jgi:putative sterol carrier protein
MREIIAKIMIGAAAPPEREPLPAPAVPRADRPATAPENRATEVERLMRSLTERIRPGAARGWNATFHCRIHGSDKPEWTVHIEDGRCRVEEGLRSSPDCVVQLSEETYVGIESGAVDPRTAFVSGAVKVSNLGQMIRFIESFRARPRP